MKTALIGVVTTTLTMVLAGCATGEKSLRERGYAPMSQAELEQEHARTRTVNWTNVQGGAGTATYEADGTARVTWANGSDEGRWRIVDGNFCNQWKTVRNGAERCVRTYKTGDNEYRTFDLDGTPASTLSFTN